MSTEFPAVERAVHDALGERPTPARRRAVAQSLRSLAVKQERIAAAEDRQARKAPTERIRWQSSGKRGRQPSTFVRIERDGDQLRIFIGRQLYYQLGSPARLDVQRQAGKLQLMVATGQDGFSVVVPKAGMPRIKCDSARDLIDLDDGRHHAEVVGHSLVIGERLYDMS